MDRYNHGRSYFLGKNFFIKYKSHQSLTFPQVDLWGSRLRFYLCFVVGYIMVGVGCTVKPPSSVQRVQDVMDRYFCTYQQVQYEKLIPYFADQYFVDLTPNALVSDLKKRHQEWGPLTSWQCIGWKDCKRTSSIVNDSSKEMVVLVYKTCYTKQVWEEEFTLISDPDSAMFKIIHHRISRF